ncbi:hypothetical protein SYNTR_1736 [Candidatus Syntrophocurvum alkaliphilum]|uniref:Uncharacterized protein n=1 Tax=Candidatus Syntrophocurvum alkaliphilum TaxID=2293317 RepID=A0A6I6DCK4_9FIRM|nr:hypothetical protein [Candidatus Syntrophocurvum alkaliphilum]QGU00330.1 hypothetical protein SYNTR_1736 [Candidatus Syntrophocurvum alkaliphilum]
MTERKVFKLNKLKNFKKADTSVADTFDFDFDFEDVDLSITMEDIYSLDGSKNLFLGRFSEKDMYNMIESIGMIKHLESMGFSDILIDIDRDENYIYYLNLYWKDKSLIISSLTSGLVSTPLFLMNVFLKKG